MGNTIKRSAATCMGGPREMCTCSITNITERLRTRRIGCSMMTTVYPWDGGTKRNPKGSGCFGVFWAVVIEAHSSGFENSWLLGQTARQMACSRVRGNPFPIAVGCKQLGAPAESSGAHIDVMTGVSTHPGTHKKPMAPRKMNSGSSFGSTMSQ